MSGSIASWRQDWARLKALVTKEILVVLRDKKARTTLVLSPVLQFILFGLASTLEVRNIEIGFVSRDNGAAAEQLVTAIAASPQFAHVTRYSDAAAMQTAIDEQRIIGGLSIGQNFSRAVGTGSGAEALLLLDGRRSNAAQVVAGYVGTIADAQGAALMTQTRDHDTTGVVVTHAFNPNLLYQWFTMPSLIAVIGAVLAMSVAVQSVAREREFGTIEQLTVLPLRPWQILIGKLAPAFLVGTINALLFIALIPVLFGVPFTGSLLLLLVALSAYMLALSGLGVAISLVVRNQQQAFLGMFLILIPIIMVSGYAAPVDNMPGWLQTASLANPQRHFLVIVEGLFLKAMPAAVVWQNLWPIMTIAGASCILTLVLIWRKISR